MNKLLIEVYVPAINKVYDVIVPDDAKVYELTPLLTGAVERLAEGLYIANQATLCDGETGKIYEGNVTLEEMKLENGSRVMLI